MLVHAEVATAAYFETPRPIPSRETHVDPKEPPIGPNFTEPIERTFERVHLERGRTPLP